MQIYRRLRFIIYEEETIGTYKKPQNRTNNNRKPQNGKKNSLKTENSK